METIGEIIKAFIDLFKEIWKALWPLLRTGLSFLMWVLAALFILPCVYIAAVWYPLWESWGKEF